MKITINDLGGMPAVRAAYYATAAGVGFLSIYFAGERYGHWAEYRGGAWDGPGKTFEVYPSGSETAVGSVTIRPETDDEAALLRGCSVYRNRDKETESFALVPHALLRGRVAAGRAEFATEAEGGRGVLAAPDAAAAFGGGGGGDAARDELWDSLATTAGLEPQPWGKY